MLCIPKGKSLWDTSPAAQHCSYLEIFFLSHSYVTLVSSSRQQTGSQHYCYLYASAFCKSLSGYHAKCIPQDLRWTNASTWSAELIQLYVQCDCLEVPKVILGGPEEGISQMLDSTGKEGHLIRQDTPQENTHSFDEMMLKMKNVKALRVGVLGTGTSPWILLARESRWTEASAHSSSHHRGMPVHRSRHTSLLPWEAHSHSQSTLIRNKNTSKWQTKG